MQTGKSMQVDILRYCQMYASPKSIPVQFRNDHVDGFKTYNLKNTTEQTSSFFYWNRSGLDDFTVVYLRMSHVFSCCHAYLSIKLHTHAQISA
jgi:hypothetical protein